MIRRIIYFLLVTILLGGLAGAIGFYAFEFKPKFLAQVILSAPRPPETVAAEAARKDTWQPEILGIGTLTASEGIDITPEVGGKVEELHFDSGQEVKKGQLLVKLDTATDEADMRALEADLAKVQTDLARIRTLVNKGVSPQTELDNLETQRKKILANMDRLKAVIEQKSIFAPWDGTVGIRTISEGSYLAPGEKIVWLQSVDPIYADFTVTEADYARVREGQKVTAQFNAWPDESFDGEIITTDSRMSNESRTITVRAKIANPDHKLLPGMYANVTVAAGQPEQVITVPRTAVTFSLYGDNVYVVVPAKKLDQNAKDEELAIERRFIKVGASRDGRLQILEGVAPGEQVVTAGQNKIDQGSKVVINNSIALKAADSNITQ